jgi:xanthine dehydrogenase YagR molybdenum-binding subunit
MAFAVIGKAGLKDKTVIQKMTGKWDYAADNLPGKKLFAHTKFSTIARGTIESIDTSAAEKVDGVKAITTYVDCPVYSKNITFWGQEVATVAAVDEETAMYAASLVKVNYTPGTAVVDMEDAQKAGATLAGVWADTNVRTAQIVRGDVATGMQQADIVLDEDCGNAAIFQHQTLETRSATAYWLGDHLYIWTTSQNPFAQRAFLSAYLGVPQQKVHLVSHGSGSGHGDKHTCEWGVVAAVLAKKAGMPVCNQLSRAENDLQAVHQHKARATCKMGLKNDGTITAIEFTGYGDDGGNGAAWAAGIHWPIRSTLKCPNAIFKSLDIATNTPPTGAWRCVADPSGGQFMNYMLEVAAEKVKMNPLDFRLKNFVTPDMKHQDTQLIFASNGVRECLQKAADGIGWSTKWHAPGTKTLEDGRLHGIGIAAWVDSHGQLATPVGGVVHLTADGKAITNHGQSHCAGNVVGCCHQVAETLGMDYDDVQPGSIGETDTSTDSGMEGGSTRTATAGAAFVMAAQDALDQALVFAAKLLKVSTDKISVGGGKFFETANPANSKTWKEMAQTFPHLIVGRGYTWDKKLRRSIYGLPVGTDCEVRGTEASAVEIAVDPETGKIEVLNHINALDAGRAVYLRGVEKQIFGGLEIQNWEALIVEQVIEKSSGASLNTNLWQQPLPTTLDVHTERESMAIIETDDACGPNGAKGIGEPCISTYAAFNAAFYNATGKWVKDVPMLPWKVLAALGKA